MRYTNIILCGFRATGKSTLGRAVAEKLQWQFIEMDQVIAQDAGKPIVEITNHGTSWDEFRDSETELLKKIIKVKDAVISTGGGVGVNTQRGTEQKAVLDQAHTSLLIVLTADVTDIAERIQIEEQNKEHIQRPLLNEDTAKNLAGKELSKEETIEKIVQDSLDIFKTREALYNKLSPYIINTSKINIEEAAKKIISLLHP